ncbi:MAG: GTP-binding protein [Roseburia lenta]|nr:GTP-binding protein [Roseburia lenta]
MAEIPVYFFTGFMDSGKTTLIQETLFENGFAEDDDRILIIACEDGDVEYDTEKLKTINASVATIDTEAEFNTEHLQEIADQYRPDAVFIEYNGTWGVGEVYEMELPKNWVIVQSLATVDATTFEMYMANMRSMMMEQFFQAEVVIFNRCDDNTPKSKFRGNIKAVNRPAQIVYERADGTIDDREEELPFDINADVIEISDADYALWFMDCMENPKKYDGKKVHFLGLVYNPKDGKLKRGVIVPGRFAMTCCVEDITFLGMMCKTGMENTPEHRSWIDLTARIKVEFAREYKGKGPILYPIEMKPAEKPQDELVYFS